MRPKPRQCNAELRKRDPGAGNCHSPKESKNVVEATSYHVYDASLFCSIAACDNPYPALSRTTRRAQTRLCSKNVYCSPVSLSGLKTTSLPKIVV